MTDRGPWIQTRFGRFYPFDPHPSEIHIEDIALSLSRTNRWRGLTAGDLPMNDAHHSLLVSLACSPENALAGLLHDSGEMPFGDLPSPIKNDPRLSSYVDGELFSLSRILMRYGLSPYLPAEVIRADAILAATEARDLVPWIDPEYAAAIADVPTLPDRIVPLSAKASEELFLARFHHLYPGDR